MAIEQKFKNYKNAVNKVKSNNSVDKKVYDLENAIDLFKNELTKEGNSDFFNNKASEKEEVKDKAYLKKLRAEAKNSFSKLVYSKQFAVRKPKNEIKPGEDATYTKEEFIDILVSEIVGYSILEDAMQEDNGISDIFIMSWNKIYVEKKGVNVKYEKTFRSREHYNNFVARLLTVANKEINNGDKKIVDFEAYGDRYCATSDSVSIYGISLTIRKHSSNHIVLSQVINGKTMTPKVADILGTIILGECNLIYGGITGSGKTTTLRALLDYYVKKANKRLLVCEDTRELMPENDHTLELVTSKNRNDELSISLDDLIITALRLKPKYIAVGEVRGKEAKSAIEGAETGHSTIFTMHGGTVWNVINRLVTKYLEAMPSLSIDVVERIIGSAIDYIAIQDDIPGIGRRVTIVSEISYDFNTRRITIKDIVRYNFKTGDFDINKLSYEKAEKMMRRGVSYEKLKDIVDFSGTYLEEKVSE